MTWEYALVVVRSALPPAGRNSHSDLFFAVSVEPVDLTPGPAENGETPVCVRVDGDGDRPRWEDPTGADHAVEHAAGSSCGVVEELTSNDRGEGTDQDRVDVRSRKHRDRVVLVPERAVLNQETGSDRRLGVPSVDFLRSALPLLALYMGCGSSEPRCVKSHQLFSFPRPIAWSQYPPRDSSRIANGSEGLP